MEVIGQLLLQLLLLVFGFVLLIKGADWFVDGAAGIAKKFGIPELVIGLTIVAMGTSAPEAAVSISAAFKGTADITVGNVVGSNILNILIILGITAVIIPVAVQKSTMKTEIPFMIVITLVMLLLGVTGGEITRLEACWLIGLFLVYLAYLFKMAKDGKSDAEDNGANKKEKPIWQLFLLCVIGVVMIVFGSDFSVDAATAIAKIFGVSDRFIALTVVALGTSLPELVTSVTAAKKGSADIAIGNVVGSNIFNILFVVGLTAIITPVPFASKFIVDMSIAAVAGVLLLIGVWKHKELRRPTGIVMLVGYLGYFVYLLFS